MYSSRGWSYTPPPKLTATSAYRRRRRPWPRLPRPGLSPLPVAVALVSLAIWYHFVFAGFRVAGSVVDASTRQPIAGARLWSGKAAATSGADGAFVLDGIKPPEPISADAPGYRPVMLRPLTPGQSLVAQLEPISVEISAVDAETGRPIPATTLIQAGPAVASPLGDGRLRVAPVRPKQRLELSADGYAPAELTYDGQTELRISLQPKLGGRVTDARTGQPVAGARIVLDGSSVLSSASDGSFELGRRAHEVDKVVVLAPGYRRATLDLRQQRGLDVQLEPNPVHAIYMTYFAIAGEQYRQQMYQLLDSTEVNAVVIDVKGDYGLLSYASRVPLAQQIGANDQPTIDDLDALLTSLHQHGAYAIARIVVFKDNVLARNGPRAGLDLSVKDRRTGQPWVDGENLAWVDPFQPAAWDYNTALAREAIERGFDEVQFDYIRFATDPSANSSVQDIQYSQPFTEQNRVAALKGLLERAHAAVNQAGGFLGMDTFGYTTWWDDDGGIGQDLQALAEDIDYYCPMVYPSTFNAGLPGEIPYPDVVSRPYDVIHESLLHVQQKLEGKHVVVRPWLQYFDDYPWATKARYDAPQIEAQKRAVTESKALGWMLWNPGSLFKRGGLAPKQ